MRESRKPPPFRSLEDSVLRGFFVAQSALCAFFLEKLEVLEILEALDFLEAIDSIDTIVAL